jgi:hypothetical protein
VSGVRYPVSSLVMNSDRLRLVADGSGSNYIFDLSKIPHSSFSRLIKGIAQYLSTEIFSLTFNAAYANETPADFKDEVVLASSVLNRVTNYFRRILLALETSLPSSHLLTTLKFSRLHIDSTHIPILAKVLVQAPALRTVEFEHMDIRDPIVIAFFDALGANRAPKIVFRDCPVTDNVLESVCRHIRRSRRKTGFATEIEFINTSLSAHTQSIIRQVQCGEPPKESDKGETDSESSGSEKSDISIPPPDPPEPVSVRTTQNIFERDVRLFNLPSRTKVEALIAENTRLRVQIERLKRLIRDVEDGGLFIVGDGCESVLELMRKVDARFDSFNK